MQFRFFLYSCSRVVRRIATIAVGIVFLSALFVMPSAAQDRAHLVDVLGHARDFRVRVQAAFALANSRDAAVVPHLERALRDRHAAVRAAAATGLGRIGNRSSIPALRRATRDASEAVRMQAARALSEIAAMPSPAPPQRSSEPAPWEGVYAPIAVMPSEQTVVAWPSVRYVLMLGDMSNRSGYAGNTLAQRFRQEVESSLRLLRTVAVFNQTTELDARAKREIERRRLPKMRVEGNVVRIDRRSQQADIAVRCEVSLMLLNEPDRAMRGVMNGAATGMDQRSRNSAQQERVLAEQALAGAVRSALARAPQALQRATQN